MAKPTNRDRTRRCTRPPTACALVASSRRSGFRWRVSLVVVQQRAAWSKRRREYSGRWKLVAFRVMFRVGSPVAQSLRPWRDVLGFGRCGASALAQLLVFWSRNFPARWWVLGFCGRYVPALVKYFVGAAGGGSGVPTAAQYVCWAYKKT